MVGGILLLIIVNGLGFFWPHTLYELTLKDGTRILGELNGQEIIPHSATAEFPEGKTRIRLKVGNRDLYGLDFRWVDEDQIVSRSIPQDAIVFERREWGNFYGRIQKLNKEKLFYHLGRTKTWRFCNP